MRLSLLYAVFGTALLSSAAAIPVAQGGAISLPVQARSNDLLSPLTS